MIRNIIFDIGNVLIDFKPADFLDKMGYPEETKNIILKDIFKSIEWQLIDNGDLTTGQAIDRIASHSSLKRQEIADIFNLRIRILYPIDRNIKLIPALKKQGLRLYFLSNFPGDIFDEVRNQYSFFSFFDGGIISASVNASKPNRRIFEILMEKYSLSPGQCLFIDDLEQNVLTAETMGMTGIWLYDSINLGVLLCEKLKTNY